MKQLLYLLLLSLVFQSAVLASTNDTATVSRIKALALQVQKKHAPDKRSEYFQISEITANPLSFSVEATRPEALAELKALLANEKIRVSISEQVLPEKELGDKVYGVANLSVINSRYSPSHTAEMATQSLLGTPLRILKKERGNYFVRTPDNYLSWTESAGVTLMNEAEFKNWLASEKVVYQEVYGHAYSEPSEASFPVSDLVAGNILQLTGRTGDFYKVAFPDKRIAYIPVKKMQLYKDWTSRPDPSAEQVIRTAKAFLGVPYLWGGTSTKGMDCSGFTKTSYFLHGIVLPRDASQQALVGEKIDIYSGDTVNIEKAMKNLRPGDLLFFAADKRTKRVTHTAIYMGDGEFIQAAGLVRINSMLSNAKNYDDFQSRTFVSARRILSSVGNPEITRVDQHPYYQTANFK